MALFRVADMRAASRATSRPSILYSSMIHWLAHAEVTRFPDHRLQFTSPIRRQDFGSSDFLTVCPSSRSRSTTWCPCNPFPGRIERNIPDTSSKRWPRGIASRLSDPVHSFGLGVMEGRYSTVDDPAAVLNLTARNETPRRTNQRVG